MSNPEFRFKQFSVRQDGSAMKVGTDGVLLGAWCSIPRGACRALDIGTGTGLIALMAAQRGPELLVDAVEIDPSAAGQARQNILNSPWANRISAIHDDINHFADSSGDIYELVVSNPPYFAGSLLPPDRSRTAARHTTLLDHCQLADAAARLLAPGGLFSVILPSGAADNFIGLASTKGLHLVRRTDVHPAPGMPPKRTLMEFSQTKPAASPASGTIIIESGGRHRYSGEYISLTRDFYLKFT